MRASFFSVCLLMSSTVFATELIFPAAQLDGMARRFVPVDVKVDVSSLPENEKLALRRMIEAARLFDPLFMRQVSAIGPSTLLLLTE